MFCLRASILAATEDWDLSPTTVEEPCWIEVAPPLWITACDELSPIIFIDWLLWSTSLLSCLLSPRGSTCPLDFSVNILDKKSVSSYLLAPPTPEPWIVPGWFSITFLYSFWSNSARLYRMMPPPDIRLPLAFALTRSSDLSAIPPLSKTGELTPFSVPSNEFYWPAFQVGSRLLECEFCKPLTRLLDMPELLFIPASELTV